MANELKQRLAIRFVVQKCDRFVERNPLVALMFARIEGDLRTARIGLVKKSGLVAGTPFSFKGKFVVKGFDILQWRKSRLFDRFAKRALMNGLVIFNRTGDRLPKGTALRERL